MSGKADNLLLQPTILNLLTPLPLVENGGLRRMFNPKFTNQKINSYLKEIGAIVFFKEGKYRRKHDIGVTGHTIKYISFSIGSVIFYFS